MYNTAVYFWEVYEVRLKQFGFAFLTFFFVMVPTIVIYVLWAYDKIPSLPYDSVQYAVIYFMPLIALSILNFITTLEKDEQLLLIVFYANFFCWVIVTIPSVLIPYELYLCYIGTLPLQCRDTQSTQLLMLILTSICFFALLFILLLLFSQLLRLMDTDKPSRVVAYTQPEGYGEVPYFEDNQ